MNLPSGRRREVDMPTHKSDHATPAKTAAALKSYRTQIDKLDQQILDLINKRASLAAEIGKVKSDQGEDIFNPAREEEVYANIVHANKGPLDVTTVRAIYRDIMS